MENYGPGKIREAEENKAAVDLFLSNIYVPTQQQPQRLFPWCHFYQSEYTRR